MDKQRRENGRGSFVSEQRKLKVAGKSYIDRNKKQVAEKQEPNREVSLFAYILFIAFFKGSVLFSSLATVNLHAKALAMNSVFCYLENTIQVT